MNRKLSALLKVMYKHECPMCHEPTRNDEICEDCLKLLEIETEKYRNESYKGEWK